MAYQLGEVETSASRIYIGLRPECREIRLITIAPGIASDNIYLELSTVSLSEKAKYEALSYVWGDSRHSRRVYVCGNEFRVTENLEAALRQLRLAMDPRTLWVDAICINQRDVVERNSQVLLMEAIYRNSTKCVVWLGEEEEDTAQALRLIQSWASDVHFGVSLDWSEQGFEAVKRLLRKEYWCRVWTIQETIIPAEVLMLCGYQNLKWEALRDAAANLLKHISSCDCGDKYSKLSRGSQETFDHFIDVIDEMFIDHGRPSKRDILQILESFRGRKATDPRDKVFGLLSLADFSAGYSIIPDYDAKSDLKSTYVKVTLENIRHRHTLEILSYIHDNSTPSGLPSWVPDWRLPTADATLQTVNTYRYNLYNASYGQEALGKHHIIGNDHILEESSLFHDEITHVGACANLTEAFYSTLRSWHTLAYDQSSPSGLYLGKESFSTAFWRTILLDSILDANMAILSTQVSRATADDIEADNKWWPSRLEQLDGQVSDDPQSVNISSTMVRKRFFLTRRGYMGIGPVRMEVGDGTFVLAGGKMPIVLRRSPERLDSESGEIEDCFRFIGNCYLHGFMDGEAVRDFRSNVEPLFIK